MNTQNLSPEERIQQLEAENQILKQQLAQKAENEEKRKNFHRNQFLAQSAESIHKKMPKPTQLILIMNLLNKMRQDACQWVNHVSYEENGNQIPSAAESEYDSLHSELCNLLVEMHLDREEVKEYA